MADTKNRGKSSHASKHFCSIEQAAAMGEEAVKIARAERVAATAELVKAFEGRIAGLERRVDAAEIRLAWAETKLRPWYEKWGNWLIAYWYILTGRAAELGKPFNGPMPTQEATDAAAIAMYKAKYEAENRRQQEASNG